MPRRRVSKRPRASKDKASRARRQNPLWVSNRSDRHGCRTGKLRFRNEEEARTALRSARAVSQSGEPHSAKRREDRYYPCEHCGGYHLTSAPERPPGP